MAYHASKLSRMMIAKSVTSVKWSIFMVFSAELEISDEEAEAPATVPFLLTQGRDLKKCKHALAACCQKKRKIPDC